LKVSGKVKIEPRQKIDRSFIYLQIRTLISYVGVLLRKPCSVKTIEICKLVCDPKSIVVSMPAAKGKDSLEASFRQAQEALDKLDTTPSDDPKQLNLATSLLHDLEKKVMRLTDPDERDECRTKLEELQQRLHDASGEDATPGPSPAAAHPGEVVGDIDDLFSGMQIADAGDSTKQEFVPQAIPGRRYMKVLRTSAGGKGVAVPTVPSPAGGGASGAASRKLPRDAEDIAGQRPEKEDTIKIEDSDDENGRYKVQNRNIPSSPLRILLPDMPLAEAAAAAAGAASHGSADSTMARGGGDDDGNGGGSDSDDDSITSPDNYNEASSFRK
jgi:hypothetical protein